MDARLCYRVYMESKDLRLRDIGIKQPQCSATTRSGAQCKKTSVTGATVCASHGGAAPQVKAAGRRRVADEIASRLPKAFEILDAAWKKAEEDGDATLAWKLISTGLALEMRAEDKREREEKPVELKEVGADGRPRDPHWAELV